MLSLSAKGLTHGEIAAHLAEIYGVSLSKETVTRITDGQFTVTGPMATGTRVRMGRTAVLDTGAMQIVVSEGRSEPFDTGSSSKVSAAMLERGLQMLRDMYAPSR